MKTLQTALAATIYERYEKRVLNRIKPGSDKATPPMLAVATKGEIESLLGEVLAGLYSDDVLTAPSLGVRCEALLNGCEPGDVDEDDDARLAEIIYPHLAGWYYQQTTSKATHISVF